MVKNHTLRIFIIATGLVLICNIILQLVREPALSALFYDYGFTIMSDFTQPLLGARKMLDMQSYANCIQPPMGMLLYAILSFFLPKYLLSIHFVNAKFDSSTVLLFLIVTIMAAGLYYEIIRHKLNGQPWEKIAGTLACLLIYPFLFACERGNNIVLAFLFTMLFAFFMDSPSRALREMALISLAIAVGIKTYTVVFGLMLPLQRRWKDSLRCMAYGLIFFFVPFLFFGGLSQFGVMLKSLTAYASSSGATLRHYFFPSLQTPVNYLLSFIKGRPMVLSQIKHYVGPLSTYIPICVGVLAAFLCKEPWKKWYALTLAFLCVPGVSGIYTEIFLLMPFICLMNCSSIRKWDYVYLVPTLMAFMPIAYTWEAPTLVTPFDPSVFFVDDLTVLSYGNTTIALGTVLASLAVSVLFVIVLIDVIKSICALVAKRKCKKNNQVAATVELSA